MRARVFVPTTLLFALVVAGVVSSFASGHPDGLEHVAGTVGFLGSARDSIAAGGPLADYVVVGFGEGRLSAGLAGVVGCLMTFALVAVLLRRRS